MSDPFRLLDHYAGALLAGFAASAGGAFDACSARHRRLADALAKAVATLDPALSTGDLAAEATRRRTALLIEAPALLPHVELLDRCAAALGEVLSGTRAATDVMFPGGAMDLVARIYDGTAWADHFNRLAAEAVARLAEALLADGVPQVRILEVGAGTGGTSRHVLGALERFAGAVSYDYTDLSPGFVAHGQARFARRHEFARFRVLDIERSPIAQGFEAGAYHAVVATNVLHATRRIDQALGHAGGLLAPGGALVLNEVTRASLFATLTFGLLDGWWRFEDADARLPGAPLLDRARWTTALASAGFAPPACFGWQGAADSFQTLFVGEWPGPVLSAAPPLSAGKLAAAPAPIGGPIGPVVPVTPRAEEAVSRIAAVVARVLGLDVAEIEPDRPLADLGVDSIVAAQIATALADSLDVALAPSEIYDHATVAGLERHLAGSLPAAAPVAPASFASTIVSPAITAAAHVDPADASWSIVRATAEADAARTAPTEGLPVTQLADAELADAAPADTALSNPKLADTVLADRERALAEPAGRERTAWKPPDTGQADTRQPDPENAAPGSATDVAVIGIACRFPGAADREAFWRNLVAGVCSIIEVPAERWDWRPHFASTRGNGCIVSRWGGFLDGHDLFDPEPFRITHGEARAMSPQQRLFLETAWHALEDAGYGRAELAGTKMRRVRRRRTGRLGRRPGRCALVARQLQCHPVGAAGVRARPEGLGACRSTPPARRRWWRSTWPRAR